MRTCVVSMPVCICVHVRASVSAGEAKGGPTGHAESQRLHHLAAGVGAWSERVRARCRGHAGQLQWPGTAGQAPSQTQYWAGLGWAGLVSRVSDWLISCCTSLCGVQVNVFADYWRSTQDTDRDRYSLKDQKDQRSKCQKISFGYPN